MRRFVPSIALAASLTILSACGDSAENTAVTDTRMDDLDSLEGTISDDAINTDQSTEEGPIEAAPAATPAAGKQQPKASKEEGDPDGDPVATETDAKADTE